MKTIQSCSSDYDFNAELPQGISFFTVRSLARIWGVSDVHVFNLVDCGEIEVGVDLKLHKGSRSCIRIPRSCVIKFLNKRKTA